MRQCSPNRTRDPSPYFLVTQRILQVHRRKKNQLENFIRSLQNNVKSNNELKIIALVLLIRKQVLLR